MSFLDRLKKKAEELDLETKARQLQEAATQAARQARAKAGDLAVEHRDTIDGHLETAATKIDAKTEGKYADTVAKVRQHVDRGVDKVAQGHTSDTSAATGATSTHGSGFDAASGGLPVPATEELVDTTLEDTVLGLDHPPTTPPGHHGEPTPEDADAGPRVTQPPHDGTS